MELEKLIAKKEFASAFNLIVKELEDDIEGKEDLKELFIFVLNIYW